MEAKTIAQADYLDILFDKRNKAYGGYVLRSQHGKRMNKALLMVIMLCVSILAMSMIPDRQDEEYSVVTEVITCPIQLPTDLILPPEPTPPAPEPPAGRTTVQNTPPVVVPDETEELILPPPVDSLIGSESGPVTNTGNETGPILTQPSEGTGTGTTVTQPAAPPIAWAPVMPEFKGDIYQYLSKHIHYPNMAMQDHITGKVLIRFVVNENGSISNVEVVRGIGGGCDEEAKRVVQNMPKWSPGMQNGRAVKVYFTLPINFRLE